MNKKPESKPFHSAKDEVTRSKHKRYLPEEDVYPYKLAFTDQEFLLRQELRPVRLQLELLKTELVLQEHGIDNTLVVFGSARMPEHSTALAQLEQAKQALAQNPTATQLQKQLKIAEKVAKNSQYLVEAQKLARIATADKELNLVVVTGGGPGFMQAANQGAHSINGRSIALNVMLPNEQDPNPYITPELTFQFHYFAIRKMHFLMRAKALTAFPGGFGTMDELFEALTLIQTKKIDHLPLILFHEAFWREVINFEGLVEQGTISETDLSLIQYVETAEQAWDIIKAYYRPSK